MDFITRETLNTYIGDKTTVNLEDLTRVIEEQFGVVVKIEKNKELDRMTKSLSENEELIGKLKKAREKREPGFPTYIRNKEDFMTFLKRARDDVK